MGFNFFTLFCLFIYSSAFSMDDCPSKDSVVSFNIGFTYIKSPKIPKLTSPAVDMETMREISSYVSSESYDIDDQMITTKEDFLARIKKKAERKSSVFFNFSGHGILTSKGEFALALPNVPGNCFKNVKASKKVDSLYRGIISSDYAAKSLQSLARAENLEILSDQRDARDIQESINADIEIPISIQVFNEKDSNCKKFFITGPELIETFAGKKIYGFIDSCFSGAIQKNAAFNAVYSSSDSQVSADNQYGGVMFALVKKLMVDYSCSLTNLESNKLSLQAISDLLPKVALKNPLEVGGVQLVSIDEAISHATQKLRENASKDPSRFKEFMDYLKFPDGYEIKGQNPKKPPGQTLGSSVSSQAKPSCFILNDIKTDKCESPFFQTYQTTDDIEFNCGESNVKKIAKGTSIRVFQKSSNNSIVLALPNNSAYMNFDGCNPRILKEDQFQILKIPFEKKIEIKSSVK